VRGLNPKQQPAPDHHKVVGPYHSFARADAAALAPGEVATMRLSLLPTSWRVAAGHRLRVALAGADSDNFGQVPHGRPPLLAIHRGGTHASSIALPLRPC
jgi:predicted acyl esterase